MSAAFHDALVEKLMDDAMENARKYYPAAAETLHRRVVLAAFAACWQRAYAANGYSAPPVQP